MRKTSKGCNVDKWGIKQKAGIRPLSALRVNFVLKTHKKRQPLLFHWIPFFCEKSLIPPFATFWKPHPTSPFQYKSQHFRASVCKKVYLVFLLVNLTDSLSVSTGPSKFLKVIWKLLTRLHYSQTRSDKMIAMLFLYALVIARLPVQYG